MTTRRVPKQLLKRYDELMRERTEAAARVEALDEDLASLDYAMHIPDRDYLAPDHQARRPKPSRLITRGLSLERLPALRDRQPR